MDPEETTPETPETPAETPAETPDTPDTPEEPTEPEKPALTPEQLAAELTRVRAEAASWRTKLRDAEAQLANAKTPEEFDAAVAELRDTNAKLERDLLVTKVSSKYELPPELAARLQGEDEAAIEADAKILAALVTKTTPESLSGGLTPGESDDEFDPVAAAHEVKKQMRRF